MLMQQRPRFARGSRFFLEMFAGKGGVTEAVQLQGVPTLPPIDIVVSGVVSESVHIVDAQMWSCIMEVIAQGCIFFLHCGTPCNTFTAARKDDGGPPPLRSLSRPLGLPDLDLSLDNQCLFLLVTCFCFAPPKHVLWCLT